MTFSAFSSKNTTSSKRINLILLASLLIFNLWGLTSLNSPKVYAIENVEGTIELLKEHCEEEVSNSAVKACNTRSNLVHARNVATYSCKDKNTNNNEKYRCILNGARGYISEAANKRPNNPSKFDKELDDILMKAANNDRKKLNNPSEDSQQGAEPESDTGGGLGCQDGKCIDPAADPNATCDGGGCDLVKKYVNPIINLLSVSFGLIAVISIIIGGIQYTASAGDPQKVTEAKKRIANTIIAIVAYFFLYAFLQFLIPGGIFNR